MAAPSELVADWSLEFALFPESRARNVFECTRVAIDVILNDGSRLSEHGAVDQYGFTVRADDMAWADSLTPDQWNLRRIDLGVVAGRWIVGVELVVDAEFAAGYLDGPAIVARRPEPGSPVDAVVTTRGSHSTRRASRGNTFPAVAVPHGFNFTTAVTDARDDGWVYSYHAHDTAPGRTPLRAVAISHLASPWMRDHGVLQLIPTLAPDRGRDGALTFSHGNEIARPHRYDVATDQGIRISFAPTDHAVLLEFRYPGRERALSIDSLSRSGHLEVIEDGAFQGFIDTAGRPRLYFAGRADAAVVDTSPDGEGVPAAGIRFTDGDEPLRVAVATSFLSVEQANRALAMELPADIRVDDVAARAGATWDAVLSRVVVDGASADQITTLYSNLYRIFLYPNSATEDTSGGSAHHDLDTRDAVAGPLTVNNGFWDTYRTTWPVLSLLCSRTGELLEGFAQHFRSTGWMPRWSALAAEDCMVGTSSDIVFADALVAGVGGLDEFTAFDSALRNALSAPPHSAVGRADSDHVIFAGYGSTIVPESVSWTLENAINDYGIARMAAVIAARHPVHPRREELDTAREYFGRRALGYRALFDADTGFFRGRDAQGRFEDAATFDPRRWGHDYAETNAWGMAFSAPHDGAGLAALHGGAAGLEAKLDEFFATPETGEDRWRGSYPDVIHEMTEARDIRMGMFGLSNQPAHHIPFMYLFTDAPHKAEAVTREALARCFLGSDIGQGYPGDEDNGELSAWWLLAAMGLYPLTPASGTMVITSPLFERMTLRLASGAELVIVARDQGPRNIYIQSLSIDGRPWTSRFVPLEIIQSGATLEFRMGPAPSAWSSIAPPSLSDDAALMPLVDLTSLPGRASASHGDPASAFDDQSISGIRLPAGGWVRWDFDAPVEVGLYSVTSMTGERLDWELDARDPAGWHTIDSRAGGAFRWDRETRVFRARAVRAWAVRAFGAPSVTAVRLRTRHPLDLRQLELFTPTAHREDQP